MRRSEPTLRRSGVGDVISNLGAIEDWKLAFALRGEPVDGLAVTFARTAATAILHRFDSIDDDAFLVALAESLVLSGLAMATAGSSRPCSGGDHEILHAIDHLFPGTANHGELAGVASLFCAHLREDGDLIAALADLPGPPRAAAHPPRPRAHRRAVRRRPSSPPPTTRPGRFTILEHLDLTPEEVTRRVHVFAETFDR